MFVLTIHPWGEATYKAPMRRVGAEERGGKPDEEVHKVRASPEGMYCGSAGARR